MNEDQETTHFGFQRVSFSEKTEKVAGVFQSVASKYDLMNDLMSFGVHRLWKRFTIELASVRPGQFVLDLAGGTGDLAAAFAHQVGENGCVVLADINQAMLKTGRDRLIDKGVVDHIDYVQANAEHLSFADNTFDCITMAFGLRNVTNKEAALKSMFHALKPGGKLLILEFSKPSPLIRPLFNAYSFSLIPWLGRVVVGDPESYRYLAESIRMHPGQETLKTMMMEAGFENCSYNNLTGGIVALHRGQKA